MAEERYELSMEASTALLEDFRDWNVVAGDLENMAVGQKCFMYTHYPSSQELLPKMRAESNKKGLGEALGERRDSYELIVEESETVEGGWDFGVKRIK